MTANPKLIPVKLDDLRPTQITVGGAEVATKRVQWTQLKRRERARTLEAHWFPAVRGPGGSHFIVDHHHLGRALHEESVKRVWVMQLDDLSEVQGEQFWRLMEFHRWAHPFDEKGKRRDFSAIPHGVGKLRDDPYRSLAGFVRKAGGYAKDAAPYAEFLWADHFRPLVPIKKLQPSANEVMPQASIDKAVVIARQPAARCLPGWTGVTSSAPTPIAPAA
jgi:hypothetical protein